MALHVFFACILVPTTVVAVLAFGTARDTQGSSEIPTKEQQTFDPCSSAPCTNGGICVPFPTDNYTCLCDVGDFGKHCGRCKQIHIYLIVYSHQCNIYAFSLNCFSDLTTILVSITLFLLKNLNNCEKSFLC